MRFDVFTLFPSVFQSYFDISILQRAIQNNLLDVKIHNIRDWSKVKHHITDDAPFGGGGGMVMKPEPVFAAVEEVLGSPPACPLILMTPQGRIFNQRIAMELATFDRIGLLCGRYEGVDERIRQHLVTDEISIGDFVLTGGELPALIVMDAITRHVPGALGDPDGAMDDSHATGLLEYPHYTRPSVFRDWKVPEVLLSGHHAAIVRWRREQSLLRTLLRRPDLLDKADLSRDDQRFLDEIKANMSDLSTGVDPEANTPTS
jgi:tRNA (guanine37-N1)-methyltransferase